MKDNGEGSSHMGTTLKGSPVVRWTRAKVTEVFSADLRSLAALRIVLAVVVLVDLTARATDFYAHYTDEGVLPLWLLRAEQQALGSSLLSLNLLNGEPLFQALVFGVAALAALALLVGYWTRLATVVVWVMVLSIQWRNPLVISGADVLLRLLLFWGMFLPLGACWSVDRARKAAPALLSTRFLSLATVGLFMQIAFMYWFTALEKSDPEWRVDGTALHYALSLDPVSTPIGDFLLQFPALLEVMTFASLALEAFGPFLLFCPVLAGPVRTGTVLAFVGFHFGIRLTMNFGIFQLVAGLCMVCFLPGWFWDKALPKLRAALFSKRSGKARRRLPQAAARLAHNTRRSLLRTRLHAKKSVGQPPITAGIAAPADNRPGGRTPRTSTPPTAPAPSRTGDEPTMLRSSLATNLLAAFFLLYVFAWNLTNVSGFDMSGRAESLGTLLGLRQSWGMFAPRPPGENFWYVIPGTLRGGQKVDLLAPTIHNDWRPVKEASWENPDNLDENKYWRKYLEIIQHDEKDKPFREQFARYVCREWNEVHAGPLELTKLRFVEVEEEIALPDDHRRATPQRNRLFAASCPRR